MPARLPQSNSTHHDDKLEEDEDDLIKQRLKRPIRLRNEDAHTVRTQENRAALSAMRNPRHALHRLPKHQSVGKLALNAMTAVIVADTSIETAILAALGDATKRNRGPSDKQVLKARQALYHALGLSYADRKASLTQLEADLYERWVELSDDIEVDVQDWLRSGTPMGILQQMTPRGVFPEVSEETPAESQRPWGYIMTVSKTTGPLTTSRRDPRRCWIWWRLVSSRSSPITMKCCGSWVVMNL